MTNMNKHYCILKGTENWIPSEQARVIRDKYRAEGLEKHRIGITSQKFANGHNKDDGYMARVWIEKGISPGVETNISYTPRDSQVAPQREKRQVLPDGSLAAENAEEPQECMFLATLGINKRDKAALSSKDKEVYNYHHLTALLSEYGFGSDWVRNDSNGADFLAYHSESGDVLKVQLKGEGLHIAKKYEGKDIYMACLLPGERWALIPHDELKVILQKLVPNAFSGQTWIEKGTYYINPPSAAQLAELEPYVL